MALWFSGGGREQVSGFLKQMPMSGAEQAVVTDLDEAWWEDVLEEATDERLGGEGAMLEMVSGRLFVSESNVAIFQLAEAVVTEGHAKDVRG